MNSTQQTEPDGAALQIGEQSGPPVSRCRFCGAPLEHTFVDLGMSPLCESYVPADRANAMEPFYPLHAKVCEQLPAGAARAVRHRRRHLHRVRLLLLVLRLLGRARAQLRRDGRRALRARRDSLVVEIASNDGYLLQHFVARGIPALGIEPAANVAEGGARARASRPIVEFFGSELAHEAGGRGTGSRPDRGQQRAGARARPQRLRRRHAAILLAPHGVVTMEFPHLLRLIESNQFDTIYHEHFSYFSLLTARKVFEAHGLELFDVEELRSHGGSLRIYRPAHGHRRQPVSHRASQELAERERALGFDTLAAHLLVRRAGERHQVAAAGVPDRAPTQGKRIVGYGAPGKGNTLLNYCGIRTDLLDYTVDRNPYKQGSSCRARTSRSCTRSASREDRPDYILILPWNLKDEIVEQLAYARDWGAQFIVPIPEVQVL